MQKSENWKIQILFDKQMGRSGLRESSNNPERPVAPLWSCMNLYCCATGPMGVEINPKFSIF